MADAAGPDGNMTRVKVFHLFYNINQIKVMFFLIFK